MTFDVARPETMGRAHVFLRILLLVLVSWIAGSGTGGGLGTVRHLTGRLGSSMTTHSLFNAIAIAAFAASSAIR